MSPPGTPGRPLFTREAASSVCDCGTPEESLQQELGGAHIFALPRHRHARGASRGLPVARTTPGYNTSKVTPQHPRQSPAQTSTNQFNFVFGPVVCFTHSRSASSSIPHRAQSTLVKTRLNAAQFARFLSTSTIPRVLSSMIPVLSNNEVCLPITRTPDLSYSITTPIVF